MQPYEMDYTGVFHALVDIAENSGLLRRIARTLLTIRRRSSPNQHSLDMQMAAFYDAASDGASDLAGSIIEHEYTHVTDDEYDVWNHVFVFQADPEDMLRLADDPEGLANYMWKARSEAMSDLGM